ncbi:MAG: UvrD-helicase domain-containing protein [Candidatus Saccharibacteria bacterium]|nr:UvrD-helicase domain-containing protein [Candidatus Saccharibacteria bacterium]
MLQKPRFIQRWFLDNITSDNKPYSLDSHQAKIVLDNHKNTLVTARAGSGKTRTVVAKCIYLLAHEKVNPEEIIIFAFNRKARAELNERLHLVQYQGNPILPPDINPATTFHAFAHHLLKDEPYQLAETTRTENYLKNTLALFLHKNQQTNREQRELLRELSRLEQFITRSEQLFFDDYTELKQKISALAPSAHRRELERNFNILNAYHTKMNELGLMNYNQMIAFATKKLTQNAKSSNANSETTTANSPLAETKNFRYIFIDEYQDFSLLFLNLILALRENCPDSHLLAVGDDWQAINRFAGSDVKYFQNFSTYFPEDNIKLFIPTNYRSGKHIVENANYFMANSLHDFQGCKSGQKSRTEIKIMDIRKTPLSISEQINIPLGIRQLLYDTLLIAVRNPNKSIKILSRNNMLSYKNWSLEKFAQLVRHNMKKQKLETDNLTFSTIHKSKGLESDIVILLEIDDDKFPAPDHDGNLYEIFGETEATRRLDAYLLFYVAITRAKEKLFILTSTPPTRKKNSDNILNFLDDRFLT